MTIRKITLGLVVAILIAASFVVFFKNQSPNIGIDFNIYTNSNPQSTECYAGTTSSYEEYINCLTNKKTAIKYLHFNPATYSEIKPMNYIKFGKSDVKVKIIASKSNVNNFINSGFVDEIKNVGVNVKICDACMGDIDILIIPFCGFGIDKNSINDFCAAPFDYYSSKEEYSTILAADPGGYSLMDILSLEIIPNKESYFGKSASADLINKVAIVTSFNKSQTRASTKLYHDNYNVFAIHKYKNKEFAVCFYQASDNSDINIQETASCIMKYTRKDLPVDFKFGVIPNYSNKSVADSKYWKKIIHNINAIASK